MNMDAMHEAHLAKKCGCYAEEPHMCGAVPILSAPPEKIAMNYVAFPFDHSIPREAVSQIVRAMFEQESLWIDQLGACEDLCGECPRCARRMACVIASLSDPDSEVWEVWTDDDSPTLTGVIYLDRKVPGCDARVHYLFFDGKLSDKGALLRQMIEQHGTRFHRLTVEVPTHAYALAHHVKKLGFVEEGRKKEAIMWRGKWWDVIILGRLMGEADVRTS